MKKALLLSVLLFAVSSFAEPCQTINTEPYWDNNITIGYLAQAQTFEVPSPTCNTLSSWEFKLAGRSAPGQITFNVYAWGDSGPVGDPLFSQNFDWGTSDQVFDVTNIGLLLTPGQLYGAEIDLQGYIGPSVYFNGNEHYNYVPWWDDPNSGWNDGPGDNQYFMAQFEGVPEPGTLILFGSSLLGAVARWRRM